MTSSQNLISTLSSSLLALGLIPGIIIVPRHQEPCQVRVTVEELPAGEESANATHTSTPARVTRIDRSCVSRTRIFRETTPICGYNEYRQMNVGEFTQQEWRTNDGQIYRSEPEFVRCL